MNNAPKATMTKFAQHCANLALLGQIGLKSLNLSTQDIVRRGVFW
jgi:hypothetical protein